MIILIGLLWIGIFQKANQNNINQAKEHQSVPQRNISKRLLIDTPHVIATWSYIVNFLSTTW